MMNVLLKIPMQFIILFFGVMVFVFYQFNTPPVFFNKVELNKVKQSSYYSNIQLLEENFETLHNKRAVDIFKMLEAQK